MTAPAKKPERTRLHRCDLTGVEQIKTGSIPPPGPEVILKSCGRCSYHGTAGPTGLIWAQNCDKMQEKAFHLGNIGPLNTKLLGKYRSKLIWNEVNMEVFR
ncbi:hypothetical protein DL239_11290 [Sedimentitalea sp. CY04]|uniref:Uncharacterized protein n=1 Tax=Parasedimentitalea denitrificans TaxID=2211118 RepID=A0ABX0WB83_9RHOB|nr:hypothetical protein [Sedimentitalea sp. CY04]